ncbi:hypothetical protein VTN77DRAFT_2905 [Rasamsonia byssochlamydoides]|uniref:uncharacterized protein n=1 Tax=Rasamsonia byssochlamydoides TaxID=89139 RepID=UPI003743C098
MVAATHTAPTSTSTSKSSLSHAFSSVTDKIMTAINRILPPEYRETIKQRSVFFASSHPLLATLLLSQIAFSGIPLLLFGLLTVGVLAFSLVAALVVTVLTALFFTAFCVGFALLLLLPTLFVTTFTGLGVWLWGWAAYHLFRWFSGADTEQRLTKLRSGLASSVLGSGSGGDDGMINGKNEKNPPSYEQDTGVGRQDVGSQPQGIKMEEIDLQMTTKPVSVM